ncbi:restriction endonuclease subunit S (plasmid) [Deinococcus radiomollis]|uniref:hypothetical protein n=1 Tax=Deinococcus radiomollis TaxID=468916 RepID=UPI0038929041
MPKWERVKLGEVLTLQRRWVQLDADGAYGEIGIRSFGKGIFHKPAVTGLSLGDKRVLEIHPGDLVFSNVFAWEGAVAVAGESERGRIGSHRYVTYMAHPEKASADFLRLYFMTEDGLNLLRKVSPGSAGRNRTLSLARFLEEVVPLPPLPEQRRIVARVKGLLAKVEEARGTGEAVAAISEQFVVALHVSLAGDRIARVGDFLELDERKTPIEEGHQYPQVGVRSFGKGLFARETLDFSQTSYKQFHKLYSGAVVLSQVKGWEGAIGVCPESLVGRYASPEFRTFKCIGEEASPEYLAVFVRTEWFWNKLKDATRGVGARRERTRPEQFLNIQLPMPPLAEQERAVRMLEKLHTASEQRRAYQPELDALPSAILARAFAGAL